MSGTIQLEILRPDKEPSLFDITAGVYSIGQDTDCKISLPHADVEDRHAILTVTDDGCWVEDLGSRLGTSVDGSPVQGRAPVPSGHKVHIGPFALVVHLPIAPAVETPVAATAPAAAPPVAEKPEAIPSGKILSGDESQLDPVLEQQRHIKQQIHKELVDRMDIKRMAASKINKDELQEKALATIHTIVADVADRLPPGVSPEALAKEVYDEAIGLGPLEAFLEDPDVTEIMVNGPDHVYVEKSGKLVATGQTFMDDASILAIIERIVAPIGRRIDESQPYVDARLHDGSRVNAVIHPLSLVGPCLTIRKFSKTPFTDDDLIGFGTMTRDIADFVKLAVIMRKNIVVAGGTGSGKTSLLNVFSGYIPDTDRILTIEDAAELRLTQDHVVRLEARPPNIEGKGAVLIRDLVRNSLRMRPDRIVVGECRGGEALDMLQAMNTGHDGSLTTVHANSPRDVISRLETMVLMSGIELPVRAIREQIASAINLIVHESRFSDGSRKVTHVTEVLRLEGDTITMQDIFEFKQEGLGEDGKVLGKLVPTGAVPTFAEEVKARGLTIDHSMFDPSKDKE